MEIKVSSDIDLSWLADSKNDFINRYIYKSEVTRVLNILQQHEWLPKTIDGAKLKVKIQNDEQEELDDSSVSVRVVRGRKEIGFMDVDFGNEN